MRFGGKRVEHSERAQRDPLTWSTDRFDNRPRTTFERVFPAPPSVIVPLRFDHRNRVSQTWIVDIPHGGERLDVLEYVRHISERVPKCEPPRARRISVYRGVVGLGGVVSQQERYTDIDRASHRLRSHRDRDLSEREQRFYRSPRAREVFIVGAHEDWAARSRAVVSRRRLCVGCVRDPLTGDKLRLALDRCVYTFVLEPSEIDERSDEIAGQAVDRPRR